jgi:hypothetical protein
VSEPVDVESRWTSDGRLRPVAFRWHGRRLMIHAYGRGWRTGEAEHLLVQTAGDRVFELAHRLSDGAWEVVRAPHDFGPPAARRGSPA